MSERLGEWEDCFIPAGVASVAFEQWTNERFRFMHLQQWNVTSHSQDLKPAVRTVVLFLKNKWQRINTIDF